MFCINCGFELPDTASFCLKCGTPQLAASGNQKPPRVQGRWEYQEFSKPIPGNLRYGGDYYDSHLKIRGPVDAVVRSLLEQLAPSGWEPMEPIDFERLLQSGRVITKTHGFLSFVSYEPIEVRINFRRWVTDASTNIQDNVVDADNKRKGWPPAGVWDRMLAIMRVVHTVFPDFRFELWAMSVPNENTWALVFISGEFVDFKSDDFLSKAEKIMQVDNILILPIIYPPEKLDSLKKKFNMHQLG